MQLLKILSTALLLMCLWGLSVNAGRLYTWVDDKGVTHITQGPPPKNAKLKFSMQNTKQPEGQNQTGKEPEKKPTGIEPEKIKTEAEKVLVFENYDEGGSDSGRHKRKPRKKKKRNE
jgi:hypothetical protein